MVSMQQFGSAGKVASNLGTALVPVTGDTRLSAASFQKTEVHGRVLIDGAKRAPGVNVWLNAPETGQTSYCPVEPNGLFHCNPAQRFGAGDFSPGRYEIRLMSPGGLYLKSISAQGAALSDGLLNVSYGSSVSLTLTAAPGQTKLDGIALRGGKPFPAAMVLLVPQPGDPDIGISRDQSDSDGTFTLPNVHPGRYFLLAIDHGRDLEYHNPRVLAPYLAHAQTIEVPAAGAAAVESPVQVMVQPRLKP